MQHLDEGTIHELLDGELDTAEAENARAHIAECGECLRLYNEAQGLLGEADRAIALLDEPRRWPLEREDLGELSAPPAANITPGVPIVLMPGASHGPRWERAKSRSYFWAAGLAVLVGAGYILLRARGEEQSTASSTTLATLPAAATAASDSTTRILSAAPAEPPAAPAPADKFVAGPAPLASARTRIAAEKPGPASPAASELATANAGAMKAAAARSAPSLQRAAESARVEPAADEAAAAPASPPPAPAAPSLETRAQLSTRIGLDDAKRELGSSLHGIDGLRPQVIGLLPGRLVPGADPARNVVRAVYQDRSGQLFYLDQQRVAPSAGALRRAGGMVVGDVQLFLHGQLTADSLRAMEDRVR